METTGTRIETFADVRRSVLDTIAELRSGHMDVSRGMAIAANVKVLNDNVLAEVAAAKLSLATEGKLHNFGQIVRLGRRVMADLSTDPVSLPAP